MKREIAQVITFQRDQLYDEIWSVPILQLAKQYGLSDVGLAKICTKMKIPRPPRGYSRVAAAKLYTDKTAITAADMLNDRVLPFFAEHGIPLLRVLTDRGTEYCGKVEHHAYQLYLALENIDHSKTKAHHPQTNGICERFHKTMKNEFYDIATRKKLYHTVEELQLDVDEWIRKYNEERPHSGKYCYGKTPMQTFLESKKIALDKIIRSEQASDSEILAA